MHLLGPVLWWSIYLRFVLVGVGLDLIANLNRYYCFCCCSFLSALAVRYESYSIISVMNVSFDLVSCFTDEDEYSCFPLQVCSSSRTSLPVLVLLVACKSTGS